MVEHTKERVPLTAYQRTKIIATIGSSTDRYEAIKQLTANGANGLILNFSHGAAIKLTDFLCKAGALKKGDIVVTVSGQHSGVVGTTGTIKVRQLE